MTSQKAVYDEMVECAEWTEESDLTAERMVEAPRKPTKKEQAKKWLKKLLMENPIRPKRIQSLARAKKHSWSTVCDAADELGVERHRKGFRGGSRWSLAL